jgi:hypothetical protein
MMSTSNSDFFKQMRMIAESRNVLAEGQNDAVVRILVNIVKSLGAEQEILPLLAANMNGQSTTLHESMLNEGRGWIKTVVGAIIGLAMALGGNAVMNIVQRMGGVPQEHRAYDVPMGSDVTGQYWGYRDDRLHEGSSSFFKRMKAIVEGAHAPNSGVAALLADLLAAIGGKEEFLDTAQADGVMNEAILEESDRRGIIAALLALILAFGAMVIDKVGAGLAGVANWTPLYTSSGNVAAWRNDAPHDPGRPE